MDNVLKVILEKNIFNKEEVVILKENEELTSKVIEVWTKIYLQK